MDMNDLLKKRCEWLKGEGPRANIAVSTRVRIARNIKGLVYFNRADDLGREEALEKASSAIEKSKFFKKSFFIKIKDIAEIDRALLVERHLMSKEHMDDFACKGIVLDEKEMLSVMLNEEDHIRLQVLHSGFDIMDTWRIVDEIDNEMGEHIAFDYSDKFGYLTACPTNTGTGLRASVMLHLGALAMTSQVENVFEAITKLGFAMRGFYGEGTEGLGDFFQISNQVALGHSEMDILDNLERIINKIINSEEATRRELFKKRRHDLEDRICRSHGTLKSARIITSSEAIKLLSAVRLGVDLGIVKDLDLVGINEVLLLSQPAHLQKMFGQEMAPYERDIKRTDMIRDKLGTG